jgi:glycosyltransferase involved in cell wall biosynthesis
MLDIPILFMVHNTLPHEIQFWDKFLAKRTLKHGDAFVLHNTSQERVLKNFIGGAKTIVCPHPTYDYIYPTIVTRSEARTNLNLPPNVPILLFFGIVRPYKGLGVLVKALSTLKEKGVDSFLIIAGEFWEDVNKYRKQIEELRLSKFIRIVDKYIPNEELADYFTAANIFVAPYVEGSQSGSLALALGFGIPAIATEHLLQGTETPEGSVLVNVQAGNPKSLARKIENLISQDKLIWKEHVKKSGDWNKLVQAFEHAYTQVKK